MMNSTPSTPENLISEFTIELTGKETVYASGDVIEGKICVKLTEGFLDINTLRMSMQGTGRVNLKGKKEDTGQENIIYLKKDWILLQNQTLSSSLEYSFPFKETLPEGLPSSVFSSKGNILYTLNSTLEYSNRNNEADIVKAVRGFTVIEELDLNKLPTSYFENRTEIEQRKFGLFSCTGGHIRLSLTFDRTAFVCGEGAVVIGRIENKSDRHIDKVSATLQRCSRIGVDVGNSTQNTYCDVYDIQEDLLAMYVVEGSSIKIDKKLYVPTTAPSTPITTQTQKVKEDVGIFHIRRKSYTGTRPSVSSTLSLQCPIRRLLTISYQYAIKVKSGGGDIIEFFIPIIVGSKPLVEGGEQNSEHNRLSFPGAIFKQCRNDRGIPLLDDKVRTKCDKTTLTFFNKYPIYPDLSTSAKQTKKLCVVASNLRTETRVLQIIRPQCPESEEHAETGADR